LTHVKRMLVGGMLALTLVLGISSAADASASTERDTASTKAFVALQERFDISAIRAAPLVNAAERELVAQIHSECPGVLTHLPKQPSQHQGQAVAGFLLESSAVLEVTAFSPLRGLVDRIARRQSQLRFSDPALQWQVRVAGSATAAYFALRPPDLCTDGRLLASDSFKRITPTGSRFATEALTAQLSATAPPSLVREMRAYAPATAATALKRLPALQRALDHAIPLRSQFRALVRMLGFRRSTVQFARPGMAP
jgi:hypothetical protein